MVDISVSDRAMLKLPDTLVGGINCFSKLTRRQEVGAVKCGGTVIAHLLFGCFSKQDKYIPSTA